MPQQILKHQQSSYIPGKSALGDLAWLVDIFPPKYLLPSKSIFAGGSSDAVIAAIANIRAKISSSANCAAILGDRSERYLDTIDADSGSEKHFGNLELSSHNNFTKA
jgi:hypothetical protein